MVRSTGNKPRPRTTHTHNSFGILSFEMSLILKSFKSLNSSSSSSPSTSPSISLINMLLSLLLFFSSSSSSQYISSQYVHGDFVVHMAGHKGNNKIELFDYCLQLKKSFNNQL
mmetsp:Transcript_18362/g.21738  ORF Transcript_18362/g.21738 Transcript_18362/m.21738 type:complete len:113 (+) Transcript_18362:2261-2599(+)